MQLRERRWTVTQSPRSLAFFDVETTPNTEDATVNVRIIRVDAMRGDTPAIARQQRMCHVFYEDDIADDELVITRTVSLYMKVARILAHSKPRTRPRQPVQFTLGPSKRSQR